MKRLFSGIAVTAVVVAVLSSVTLTGIAALSPMSAQAAATGGQAIHTHRVKSPLIYGCEGTAGHTPRQLVLFCGDGNDTLTAIKWQGWGKATATATSTDVINLCQPTCVAGRNHDYGVRVSVTDLKGSGTKTHYTHLTLTFTGSRPKGESRVQHYNLTAHGPVIS